MRTSLRCFVASRDVKKSRSLNWSLRWAIFQLSHITDFVSKVFWIGIAVFRLCRRQLWDPRRPLQNWGLFRDPISTEQEPDPHSFTLFGNLLPKSRWSKFCGTYSVMLVLLYILCLHTHTHTQLLIMESSKTICVLVHYGKNVGMFLLVSGHTCYNYIWGRSRGKFHTGFPLGCICHQ